MAAVTLGPIVSGLPKNLIEKIIEAERQPIKRLEERKEKEENRLKLINDFHRRLNEFDSEAKKLAKFQNFQELKSTVGEPELMEIFINKEKAFPGEYKLEIAQLAEHSSVLFNGFSNPDNIKIGAGYFSYQLPGGTIKEVFIHEDESTLNGIARKINMEKDLNLRAIVVDEGTGKEKSWRLIVTHNDPGEVNDAEFPNFYFIDGEEDFYLQKERAAKNSIVKVNGFEVEFDSNKVNTLLPGVTLDLKKPLPGKEFILKIEIDDEKIAEKIRSLINKLNSPLSFIQEQNKIDENTDTSRTFGSDITLQNAERMIRKLVLSPIRTSKGSFYLHEIGITFQRNGLLRINEDRLNDSIKNNFNSIKEYFSGTDINSESFSKKIIKTVDGYIKSNGLVSIKKENIKKQIENIDNQIERKETELKNTEQNLRRKFGRLEATIAKLKSQQQQIQSSLGSSGLLGQISLGGAKIS